MFQLQHTWDGSYQVAVVACRLLDAEFAGTNALLRSLPFPYERVT
jgi:hypothetical protein